jgi:hypothetical protein
MADPCKACNGTGTVVAYLGQTKPCEKCAGSGTIDVIEEPLSPWQQRVEKMLRQILSSVEPGVAPDEAEDKALGLARLHPPADLKPMDTFESRKP